ncbi:hypothetical protein LCGC14_2743010 [marine sediment metagenome]|uniref:Uncharacterized protein n=1 Tax=marine sediment metagenome TaxID=412755 RepID=A0A0F8ZR46_9ZZZZ
MEVKKLRTIEEENKRRADIPVIIMHMGVIEPHWVETGIESPFGGEIIEDISCRRCGKVSIKCSETGRLGTMRTDNTQREVIHDISWEGCSVVWVKE